MVKGIRSRGIRVVAGERPSYGSIDDYIRAFPESVQQKLTQLRELIRRTVPEAQERISYQIPTFYLKGNLVHFAAFSRHIGFYPTPSGIEKFKSELAGYKSSKGAVQFPLEAPLPLELVERIVRYRAEESLQRRRKRPRKARPAGGRS